MTSRPKFAWLIAFILIAFVLSVFGYRRIVGQATGWFAIAFILGAILALLGMFLVGAFRRPLVLFLFALVCIPPGLLIYLGYQDYPGTGTHWYSISFRTLGIILTIGGIFILFGYLAYIWRLRKEDSEFQYLLGEIKFVALQGHYLWVLAGSIACLLVGLRLLVNVDAQHLYERYETIIGTYVTVFIAVVGIKFLYRETAPIVEIDHLLRSLINDLKRHTAADRLWVVYPALNIGYYRHYLRFGKVGDDDLSEQYKRALKICAGRLGKKARAVTYPKSLYEPLYSTYDEMINGTIDQTRVSNCVADALGFVNEFTEEKPTERGTLFPIEPEQFPPHVIVIGNIIYMIMSYGLPIYEPQTKSFRPIGKGTGKEKLADLLVYRRNDPETADVISKHLEELITPTSPPPASVPTHPPSTSVIQPQQPAQVGLQAEPPPLVKDNHRDLTDAEKTGEVHK